MAVHFGEAMLCQAGDTVMLCQREIPLNSQSVQSMRVKKSTIDSEAPGKAASAHRDVHPWCSCLPGLLGSNTAMGLIDGRMNGTSSTPGKDSEVTWSLFVAIVPYGIMSNEDVRCISSNR